ncbi:anti-sigma factor [Spirosoma pollinicola]|uniref:Regulator of SigK n=1 Tax=Spirosoma pollinicola TaxID=2057025 RepID=A0A2K8Z101_9BACT|nr:anti-sigma factor [Spirosoma pollinicola]AUD03529.1 anti-sigma factor [Spirosoma pollinicola]
MNVTEYIASGILESYVMGAVSDQERREVECLSSIYPDIRLELDQLSEVLENYALSHSVEPPESVKAKLMDQLDFDKPVQETIVRPMPVDMSTTNSSPTFRVTWIVAASMGLLLFLFSFYLLSQLRTTQKRLTSTQTDNSKMLAEVRQLRDQKTLADQALAVVRQPGTRTLELKGNDKAPQGTMLVFWNSQTHQVAVQVGSLPPLPADKQYQLWSMVGGKPVDAGVFETSSAAVQRMNRNVARAEAFAVTVEKRGGSPTPTLSTLLALAPINA